MKPLYISTIVLLLGMCVTLTAQLNKSPDKPNIVIIVSDDQGNADAGFQRLPSEVETPSIDKLAKEGVVFTNGYASAYVCAPTRAGLLTGRYQQRFGFEDNPAPWAFCSHWRSCSRSSARWSAITTATR